MKKFDDVLLVEEYKKCKRCRIVAEKFGCSDETVRRALIKYDVPRIIRNPRPVTKPKITEAEKIELVWWYYMTDATIVDVAKKYHRSHPVIKSALYEYGHGLKVCEKNKVKITDEQLLSDIESGLTRKEIADKYGMHVESLPRRMRRLGVHAKYPEPGICHTSGIQDNDKYKRRIKHAGYSAKYDSTVTLSKLIVRQKGICQICGKAVDESDRRGNIIGCDYPSIDHIKPISKGGSHTWDNVQLAHMKCNSLKGVS